MSYEYVYDQCTLNTVKDYPPLGVVAENRLDDWHLEV